MQIETTTETDAFLGFTLVLLMKAAASKKNETKKEVVSAASKPSSGWFGLPLRRMLGESSFATPVLV